MFRKILRRSGFAWSAEADHPADSTPELGGNLDQSIDFDNDLRIQAALIEAGFIPDDYKAAARIQEGVFNHLSNRNLEWIFYFNVNLNSEKFLRLSELAPHNANLSFAMLAMLNTFLDSPALWERRVDASGAFWAQIYQATRNRG